MSKINTENYESFYLDYLEGNLGDNDTIELFAFLNDNPEFKVDDELLVLDNEDISLDPDFKNLLKTDIAGQAISLNNIDYFLIAQKEGQLDEVQLNALDAFIVKNPQFKKDQKMYALSTLKADTSIVYADKKKLKQRAPIVLWPYFSAAAAASVVLFFWFMSADTNQLVAVSAAQGLEYQVKDRPNTQVADGTNVIEANDLVEAYDNDTQQRNPSYSDKNLKLETPKKQNVNVANNDKIDRPVKKNEKPTKLDVFDDQKLDEHITVAINSQNPNNVNDKPDHKVSPRNNSDYSLAMKDVARPVTRKLSDIIKSEVEVKKGTDANGKREGVFFKLGNFEFYRNKKVRR